MRAAAALTDALDQLVKVQRQLRSIVNIVAERPWTDEERRLYGRLAHQERKVHRQYAATRDWFDDIRTRHYENMSHLHSQRVEGSKVVQGAKEQYSDRSSWA